MSLWDPRGSAYPRHTIRHRHSLKRTAVRVGTDPETLSRLLAQDELDRSLDRTRALSDRTSSQFVFLRLTVGSRGNAAYVRREWLLVVGDGGGREGPGARRTALQPVLTFNPCIVGSAARPLGRATVCGGPGVLGAQRYGNSLGGSSCQASRFTL